jgi:hypothetical protein
MVNIQPAMINKNTANNDTVLTDEQAQATLSSLPRIQLNSEVTGDATKPEQILCYYTNNTNQIQVVRSANFGRHYFERVIFPGQRLLFGAIPEAHIEIHTGTMATAILSDRIPCSHLCVYTE